MDHLHSIRGIMQFRLWLWSALLKSMMTLISMRYLIKRYWCWFLRNYGFWIMHYALWCFFFFFSFLWSIILPIPHFESAEVWNSSTETGSVLLTWAVSLAQRIKTECRLADWQIQLGTQVRIRAEYYFPVRANPESIKLYHYTHCTRWNHNIEYSFSIIYPIQYHFHQTVHSSPFPTGNWLVESGVKRKSFGARNPVLSVPDALPPKPGYNLKTTKETINFISTGLTCPCFRLCIMGCNEGAQVHMCFSGSTIRATVFTSITGLAGGIVRRMRTHDS